MNMLNVACGSRVHKDWVNIDFHPFNEDVIQCNLLGGLPFSDGSFDCVYSSHFLEHMTVHEGDNFLREVYRSLKKGGIVRVVVPDMENVCREYLNILAPPDGEAIDSKRYEWIVIEFLDQLTRNINGGEMQKLFNRVTNDKDQYLADYIRLRTGDRLLQSKEKNDLVRKITFSKIKNKLLYAYLKFIQLFIPKHIRNQMVVNTDIGEKHQWIYDKYSLTKKFESIGFSDITVQQYDKSQIEGFNKFHLDCNKDGTPYKGVHSIYIEATK